jgi:hypothetical protein
VTRDIDGYRGNERSEAARYPRSCVMYTTQGDFDTFKVGTVEQGAHTQAINPNTGIYLFIAV